MSGGKSSQQKIILAKRREIALELRLQHGSYRAIAEAMRSQRGKSPELAAIISPDYSDVQAMRDVAAILAEANAHNREQAEEVRRLELLRLDEMAQAIWPQTVSANPDLFAVDRLLRIMERRARLLGLDAPAKQDITSKGESVACLPLVSNDVDTP
jgi:hypothetical protein